VNSGELSYRDNPEPSSVFLRRGGVTSIKYPNGYFKPKQCRTCGKTFIPEAPSQFYCSLKCRGKTSYYKRNYGITEADLEEMKKKQNYRCYICGSEGFLIGKNGHTEKLAVDHDHATGQVRKLLCHNCNRALGLMHDDPSLLRKAANYIEEHREGATTIRKE
jgi:hypothetical protein